MGNDGINVKRGRPVGSGAKKARLLRVILTPRQDRLLTKLRLEWGLSESEHVRRALDLYLEGLLAKGEFKDDL